MRYGVVQIRIHILLLLLLPSSFLLLILLLLFLLRPLPLFLLLSPPRICSCFASWSPLLLEVGVKESLAERDADPWYCLVLAKLTVNSSLSHISQASQCLDCWEKILYFPCV